MPTTIPGTSPQTSPPIITNPSVKPQPEQGHVNAKDRMITAIAESKEGQGLLADIRHFIQSFVCRLQGSCSGRIANAVEKVGPAGYRRVMKNDAKKWEAFLSNGQHIAWDSSRSDSQRAWYGASGYWAKLRDTGLDRCCLKSASSYPPSEAFPLAADGLPFDGVVRVDADGYLADYDRIGFSEGTIKPFAKVRIVAQYTAEQGFPPFGASATGVYSSGGGIGNVLQGGLNPLVLIGGWFLAKKQGWF